MLDLNSAIAFMMGEHDPQMAVKWNEYTPIKQQVSVFQAMIVVNHFLRVQLGLLDVDTTKAREALTVEEDLEAWLEGFKEDILPVILQHGLPVWSR